MVGTADLARYDWGVKSLDYARSNQRRGDRVKYLLCRGDNSIVLKDCLKAYAPDFGAVDLVVLRGRVQQ